MPLQAGMRRSGVRGPRSNRPCYSADHGGAGALSRIDYLLVGGTANVQDARSEVRLDVDNGSPNEDHQSAALHLRGALGKGGSARPRFDLGRLNTETGKRVLEEAHHDRSKPPFIPDEAWALRQQKCQLRWRTKARHGMWRQLLSDAWATWGRWKRTSHGHGNLAAEDKETAHAL